MRDEDLDYIVDNYETVNDFVEFCLKNPSRAIMSKEKVISIAGMIPLHDGVCYVWQYPCIDFHKYMLDFVKGLRMIVKVCENKYKQHRIFTICKDEPRFYDWMIKGVGFKFECVLEGFGSDKSDYVQFSKVRK